MQKQLFAKSLPQGRVALQGPAGHQCLASARIFSYNPVCVAIYHAIQRTIYHFLTMPVLALPSQRNLRHIQTACFDAHWDQGPFPTGSLDVTTLFWMPGQFNSRDIWQRLQKVPWLQFSPGAAIVFTRWQQEESKIKLCSEESRLGEAGWVMAVRFIPCLCPDRGRQFGNMKMGSRKTQGCKGDTGLCPDHLMAGMQIGSDPNKP